MNTLLLVVRRECRRILDRPLYLFCSIIAPLFCYIFFTTLMDSGLPTDLPVGVVDLDQSATSRQLVRNLDSFQQTDIVANYTSESEARKAMQRGEVYGFFLLPRHLSRDAQAQRTPQISFYTNNSLLIAGSLLFRDMKQMSELAAGAAGRKVLYMKGATESQAMGILQPIVIETHPVGNPWVNYSVYLTNTFVPGVLMLCIFLLTVFCIGSELRDGTSAEWLATGGGSAWVSIVGKLLPYTAIFLLMATFYNVYLYGYLGFPCHGGVFSMLMASWLFVFASQAMGVLMISLLPTLRLGLSFASLWGVLSFSMCGLSFPVMGMHPTLQALANLFPLRHYFLIYVNQALNGYPMVYAWTNFVALAAFIIVAIAAATRLKKAAIKASANDEPANGSRRGASGAMLFFLVVPFAYPLIYGFIYTNETLHEVPCVVVDDSQSTRSREFVRQVDASAEVRVTARCRDLEEAKEMLRERRAYGIIMIPSEFSSDLNAKRQTRVVLYCDMSGLLYYKSLLLAATNVSLEKVPPRAIEYEDVALFNPKNGFAAFLLPVVLMLLLQQTLLLGIGWISGNAGGRIPLKLWWMIFLVYIPVSAWVLCIVPRIFSLPQLADAFTLAIFMVPYLLACIFFAMVMGSLVRQREACMPVFVFSSVPLLFMSGISWPGASIPTVWKAVSWIFPSTWGVNGFVRIGSMGAELSDVANEYIALWILAAIYLALAIVIHKKQKKVAYNDCLPYI